ncbi:hypothetical protein D9613_009329 [Agrocybe pediades]|uniref:DUF6534 domain-containing protein n=1 Tax=Agrocybe pediades TaxID=84607 RepID=A0A8H4VVS1_9AGAR|nr:hypothetical protein D9613_009329 [Agrocybe pediades]
MLEAIFIGALLACVAHGLTILQTYYYFMTFPNDTLRLKLMVGTVWLFDTVHVALTSYFAYLYMVVDRENPFDRTPALHPRTISVINNLIGLLINLNAIQVVVFFGNTLECLVQCYFVQNVYHRESSTFLAYLYLRLIGSESKNTSVEDVGLFYGTGGSCAFCHNYRDFSNCLWTAVPLTIATTTGNITITTSLIYLLRGHRSGIKKTDNLVKKLVIFAVNKFVLIAALELVEIITFSVPGVGLWYLAFDFVTAKLYANSLLASLNNRLAGMGSLEQRATTFKFSLGEQAHSTQHPSGCDLEGSGTIGTTSSKLSAANGISL